MWTDDDTYQGTGDTRTVRFSDGDANICCDVEVSASDAEAGCQREVSFTLPSTGETRTYRIAVPAGSRNGTVLRFAGAGDTTPQGVTGDLLVTVKVDAPLFPARGDDVPWDLTVSAAEAASGCIKSVTYFLPSTGVQMAAQVDVPAGSTDNQVIRVLGAGDMGENGGARGDLVVRLHVNGAVAFQTSAFQTGPAPVVGYQPTTSVQATGSYQATNAYQAASAARDKSTSRYAVVAIVAVACVVALLGFALGSGVLGGKADSAEDEAAVETEQSAGQNESSSKESSTSSSSSSSSSSNQSSSTSSSSKTDDSTSSKKDDSTASSTSVDDATIRAQLSQSLSDLQSYDSQIREVASNFNAYAKNGTADQRDAAAEQAFQLETAINSAATSFGTLNVPSSSAYYSDYQSMQTCYADLQQRITCMCDSWRRRIDGRSDYLAPITAQNDSDGINRYKKDFDNRMKGISL